MKPLAICLGLTAVLLASVAQAQNHIPGTGWNDYSSQDPKHLDAIPPGIATSRFRDLGREDILLRAGASIRF